MSFSTDGQYWWDGEAWHPVAPDGRSYWNGYDWVGLEVAPGAMAEPATHARSVRAVLAGAVVLLAAAGLVVGAILPWATLSVGSASSTSSGTDGGDGWIFVGVAVVVALAARMPLGGRTGAGVAVWIVLLGLGAGALVGYEFHQADALLGSAHPGVSGSGVVAVTYGSGLLLLAGCAAAVLVGGLVVAIRLPRRTRVVEQPVPARASVPAYSGYAAFVDDPAHAGEPW